MKYLIYAVCLFTLTLHQTPLMAKKEKNVDPNTVKTSTIDPASIELPEYIINGNGLTLDGLEDKVVYFFFFEENAPASCREWVSLQKKFLAYKDKPLILVGVVSGVAPYKVQQVTEKYKITAPVIVDMNRSFEFHMGVKGKIELKHPADKFTVKITKKGYTKVRKGAGKEFPSFEDSLDGAKWKINPKVITEKYKQCWLDFEFGKLDLAFNALDKIRKPKDEEKEADDIESHKAMHLAKDSQIRILFEEAAKLRENGEDYKAICAYIDLSERFKRSIGKEDAKKYNNVIKEMKKNRHLLKELKLKKKFKELFVKLARMRGASDQMGMMKIIKKLIDDNTDCEAALDADEIYTELLGIATASQGRPKKRKK